MARVFLCTSHGRVFSTVGKKTGSKEYSDKYVSFFEPHTDIIVKGEGDIVYGHKTFFQ